MAETDLYSRVFGTSQQSDSPERDLAPFNDSPEAEERAQQAMKNVANSEGAYNAWSGPAKEDNRFYNNHQWDDIDRMKMEQLKRPAIVFNEIKPTIDAVSGLERMNRQDVRVVSRALDSNELIDSEGDLATAAIATADDMCNGAEEDSRVAKDCAITGMGWGEVRTDYDQDIDGRVMYERISPFDMRWDPNNADKENLEGTEWRCRKRKLTRKKFEQLYPDKMGAVDLATPDMPYGGTDKYELVTPYYSRGNQEANPNISPAKKEVEILQYQWRDMQPIYRFQDGDSEEITTLNDEKWKTLQKRSKELGISPPPAVKQMQPVYRQGMYCRGVELEEPVDLPGGFSLLCTTGQWDDEKKRWYGIVRPMIDPQKTMNKAMSSALAFHITNAKGGAMFKTSFFADPINAKEQWSSPDAWIEVSDEADMANGFKQREPSQLPSELPMFFSEAKKAMSYVSGINEEMIGTAAGAQTPSQTSGRRVQAGLVVLGWLFDNLNRHRREKALVQLEFIREFWTQGQLIQVGGDYNSKAIPLLKEALPERGRYTFVLDDSIRHNPNLKAQIWQDLTESGVLQALMKFGLGRVILKLLKFSPFPSQLVNDINREVAQNPPQPPQKGRGGGKQEAPELTQANVYLKSAQAQKALAQARQIDQSSNLKVAELALEGIQTAHKTRHDDALMQHRQKIDVLKAAKMGMGAAASMSGGPDQP